MDQALPMAMVSGYQGHIPIVNLPDPNDRHVVAAGIAAGASIVLTWNLRHFPAKELKKFGLRKETPLANARRNLTKSRVSALNFIDMLRNQRLVELARRAHEHMADL